MIVEPLDAEKHNRLAFTCGNEKLDRFLRESAKQSTRKGLAAVFVAIDEDEPTRILGYYSLSSFTIDGVEIPETLSKKRGIPRHTVGATLLGRLAVDKAAQKRGIGPLLLVDALKSSFVASLRVASVCVVVDAIEASMVAFYEKYGFIRCDPESLRLVMMMDDVAKLAIPDPKGTEEAV
jgi:predicted N-acetyltransferase YhbS